MATATGPLGLPTDGRPRTPVASATFAAATGGIAVSPPSRKVRVGGAGSLVVTWASGVVDTIALVAGETFEGEIVAIDETSTATAITIFW